MSNKVYKTITMTVNNDAAGRTKIKGARREINRQQQNTALEIFNLLLSWAGIFNVALGIGSAAFSGCVSNYATFLENWEDVYTACFEAMSTYPPDGSTTTPITYVQISYDLIGTKDRCKAGNPRYVFKRWN